MKKVFAFAAAFFAGLAAFLAIRWVTSPLPDPTPVTTSISTPLVGSSPVATAATRKPPVVAKQPDPQETGEPQQLPKGDLEQALQKVLAEVENRSEALTQFADRLATEAPDQAFGFLSKLNETDREIAIPVFFSELDETDPAKARILAEQWKEADFEMAFSALVDSWAKDNPQQAAQAIQRNLRPSEQDNSMLDLAYAWGTNAPGAALAWAQSNADESLRNDLVLDVISAWAEASPQQALSASAAFTDTDMKAEAIFRVVPAWADQSPAEAARWVVSAAPEESREELVDLVSSTWAYADHRAAGDWARSLPEGALRLRALESVTMATAEEDRGLAKKWVESLPEKDRPPLLEILKDFDEEAAPTPATADSDS